MNRNLQYELKDEELAKLMAENFKPSGKKSSKQNKVVTIDERLSIINQVIEGDFKDQITRQMLNSKDYVSICLKPEVEKSSLSAMQKPLITKSSLTSLLWSTPVPAIIQAI